MILLLKLLLAHLLGDFFLQPRKWILLKEERKWAAWPLYLHVVIQGMLTQILIWDWAFLKWTLLVMGSHLLIDGCKLSFQKTETKRAWFFIDQAAHLLSIYLIYCWHERITLINGAFLSEKSLMLTTLFIFLTQPCSYLVKIFISRWQPHETKSMDESLEDAGRYIGILERLFVFTFVLTGKWEAIGFLLAAKSVFRFGDLTSAKDRKLTEYILIGTLVSFAIAIGTGLIAIALTLN
ncbi:MAG: DUF3307 domain-containing protein [Cyclobacteriaceae bacterium]|nr:DUF3307 domain-containing protein [Cyclobacteriaceae bacterium]